MRSRSHRCRKRKRERPWMSLTRDGHWSYKAHFFGSSSNNSFINENTNWNLRTKDLQNVFIILLDSLTTRRGQIADISVWGRTCILKNTINITFSKTSIAITLQYFEKLIQFVKYPGGSSFIQKVSQFVQNSLNFYLHGSRACSFLFVLVMPASIVFTINLNFIECPL